MMIPISVVIPVKNEEKNLPRSLDLLKEFSEIIVVDSGSTDKTKEIAEKWGARFINFEWNGKFPKKRNWVLRNERLKNDWVLFLDADELPSKEFIEEIKERVGREDYDGYWITFINYFMGNQLKHGDKFRKLPLFKVSKGEYEKIEEDSWSHLDMEIHEHPIIEGNVGSIKAPIIHNDYRGLEHYIQKHNAYSSWEARRYLKLKEEGFDQLNKRQRLKYKLIEMGVMPAAYFIGSFFFKAGFLDGRTGYDFARFKANYFLQIQSKIKEFQK
ncbi:glycosyltransferase family 2 protein [Zunongwangia profunda]|uniref:glycosyltransferase family 2 protein n=1 Tax=Zunongwangia profunda TaxID=398743 RepID=UPI000C948AFE|nr:glycosyltransferase family 2 protein [Zunongwangia profunda]MAG88462.1 glycosyl transferase family 2 [Flavobacteriaceae bacterium]